MAGAGPQSELVPGRVDLQALALAAHQEGAGPGHRLVGPGGHRHPGERLGAGAVRLAARQQPGLAVPFRHRGRGLALAAPGLRPQGVDQGRAAPGLGEQPPVAGRRPARRSGLFGVLEQGEGGDHGHRGVPAPELGQHLDGVGEGAAGPAVAGVDGQGQQSGLVHRLYALVREGRVAVVLLGPGGQQVDDPGQPGEGGLDGGGNGAGGRDGGRLVGSDGTHGAGASGAAAWARGPHPPAGLGPGADGRRGHASAVVGGSAVPLSAPAPPSTGAGNGGRHAGTGARYLVAARDSGSMPTPGSGVRHRGRPRIGAGRSAGHPLPRGRIPLSDPDTPRWRCAAGRGSCDGSAAGEGTACSRLYEAVIEAVKQRPRPGRGGAAQVGAEIATDTPAGAPADLAAGVPMNISVNIWVGLMPVRVADASTDGPTDPRRVAERETEQRPPGRRPGSFSPAGTCPRAAA